MEIGVPWLALALLAAGLALPGASLAQEEEEEDEVEDLRQRLTEREDQRRPLEPWQREIGGGLLTLGGEWESEFTYQRLRVFDEDEDQRPDRFGMEHTLEVEAFWSIGEPFSVFLQGQAIVEEDPNSPHESYDWYFERSEMWIASEDIFGSDVSLELGRLDFEDDRRWWWDDEVDAVRVSWEPAERVETFLAVAQEALPERTDRDFIDPETEDALRVIAQATWGWRTDHAVELFAVWADDRSPDQRNDEVDEDDDEIDEEREDDSDAELTWLGFRATGVVGLPLGGYLGYWLDTAWLRGHEQLITERNEDGTTEVDRRNVSGTAYDVGASWILPFAHDPRLFAGFARGSREFRQTSLQANEAGFGGVERFPSYGILLDPELANLSVVTAGVGLSLLRSSSLDLVYHHYQRVDAEEGLRDDRFEASLDERHHDLGHGIDLVLALEEWERFELTFALAAFRAGDAFVDRPDTWTYGAFAAVRYAF